MEVHGLRWKRNYLSINFILLLSSSPIYQQHKILFMYQASYRQKETARIKESHSHQTMPVKEALIADGRIYDVINSVGIVTTAGYMHTHEDFHLI